MNRKLLAIYLNDHHAGAVVGRELAKRALSSNKDNEFGEFLARLLREIDEDLRALQDVMRRLGITVDPIKRSAAWASEKVGRLKLNGQIRGYSPLSRLVELEGLALGVEGKTRLWRTLKEMSESDASLAVADYDELLRRAESQADDVERHRLMAASRALVAGGV